MIIKSIRQAHGRKIHVIGGNEPVFRAVAPAVEGVIAGLAVDMPVAAQAHLVLLQQAQTPGTH